jgi:hypothetical protein
MTSVTPWQMLFSPGAASKAFARLALRTSAPVGMFLPALRWDVLASLDADC